jgi:tetratricopeptide (TPR) repeat protein
MGGSGAFRDEDAPAGIDAGSASYIPRGVAEFMETGKSSAQVAVKHWGMAGFRSILLGCVMPAVMLTSGCVHYNAGYHSGADFKEANDLFRRGSYEASLDSYRRILAKYPAAADRALFEMGIVHSYPGNERKDYRKSLECFEKLVRDYPASDYRRSSQTMIFTIHNSALKDETIAAGQARIEELRQQLQGRDAEIAELLKHREELQRRVFAYALLNGPVDRIVIEKSARKLMLLARGEVIKTYKIALGGNPVGPKEMEGDNKTPEGIYEIDSRNKNSYFHRSLHISYPNDQDKKRARERGVSPGGDIMIHGIRKDLSWVGDAHAGVDWTKGCIAVTDDEIEEIDKLAPDGTVVEIRP